MNNKSPPSSADGARYSSKGHSGKLYKFNVKTREKKLLAEEVNTTPQKTVTSNKIVSKAKLQLISTIFTGKDILKTPAQDRLKRLQRTIQKTKLNLLPQTINQSSTKQKLIISEYLSTKKPKDNKRNTSSSAKPPGLVQSRLNITPTTETSGSSLGNKSTDTQPSVKTETKILNEPITLPQKARPKQEGSSKVSEKDINMPLEPVKKQELMESKAVPLPFTSSLSKNMNEYDRNNLPKSKKTSECKSGIISVFKGFCNKLINMATEPRKRKSTDKDDEKPTKVSRSSKPAFKAKKSERKNILRVTLQENEKSITKTQSQKSSLVAEFSSPTTVPKISANVRLQRLRQALQSRQSIHPAPSSTVMSLQPNSLPSVDISNSALSPIALSSEIEPMDWTSVDEDPETVISPSPALNTSSVDSSNVSEHYSTISENLLRLSAAKKQTEKWKPNHYYFVVDTNVLINSLTFVEELKTMKLLGTKGSLIFIPYCVLQELDKLKFRSHSESIKIRAVRAIKYLNKSFEESHQLIHAQSAADETKHLIKVTSPDDSILNCCLQVMKHVEEVLLLSEDVNLQNKAKCNGILVSTKSDLISKH